MSAKQKETETMWVFTNRGFYSVVQDKDDASMLVIRARAKDDLMALKPLIPGLRIVVLPNRDYEFRAFVERIEWEAAMVELVEDIDYSNFKDSVTAKQGKARHDIYLRVWSAMLAVGRLTMAQRYVSAVRQRQFDFPGELSLDPWADPDYPSAAPKAKRGGGKRKAARS